MTTPWVRRRPQWIFIYNSKPLYTKVFIGTLLVTPVSSSKGSFCWECQTGCEIFSHWKMIIHHYSLLKRLKEFGTGIDSHCTTCHQSPNSLPEEYHHRRPFTELPYLTRESYSLRTHFSNDCRVLALFCSPTRSGYYNCYRSGQIGHMTRECSFPWRQEESHWQIWKKPARHALFSQ